MPDLPKVLATIGTSLELDRCPHCNVDTPFIGTTGWKYSTKDHLQHNERRWTTYYCHRCGGVILVAGGDGHPASEIYPRPMAFEFDASIPKRAREYLKQARDSLHAPAGSLMLSASAVDAMLKDKGFKVGSLYQRIDAAVEQHVITDGMGKWAHQVRLDANDQRHADEDAPLPTKEDASRSIAFALALAQFVFVLPSLVDKGIEDTKDSKMP